MEKTKKYLLYILLFALTIQLFIILNHPYVWWDGGTYIGIGKYLLSDGRYGYMEFLRPMLLPTILGIAWKIGIDPIIFGRMFAITCSLATIYMTYLITKKIHNEKAAILAATILCITYTFIFFSTRILTGIPSILLILIATNELINNKLTRRNIMIAGIATALAFLMRYTAISLILPILFGIIINSRKSKSCETKIDNIITYALSFGITLTPYIIYTQIKYNDALFSISRAITVIKDAEIYYTNDIANIAYQLLQENPLLILSIAGIYYYTKNINTKRMIILAELAMSIIIFLNTPVKILRYTLIILPFLSITAGSGLFELLKKTKIHNKIKLDTSLMFIGILLILGTTILYPNIPDFDRSLDSREKIHNYIKTNNIAGQIISTDPTITAHIDNPMIALGWPIYSEKVYKDNKNSSSLILINNCDMLCPQQDNICENNKKEFIKQIENENKKVLEETIAGCKYMLFETTYTEKKQQDQIT